ncbi:MAG: thiamine pyrophosphate-dependent enzyme, partial [Oscillospiraceae bacterium]|nr:thiamine pyrophosphate-dependent enzyme [Oscillospiraceae bacterium]
MPKCQFIDPAAVRAKGELSFDSIPLNQYQTPFAESAKGYRQADLLGIYHDMQVIREFEGMLYSVRTTKQYNGVDYVYTGPAHLYTGQEAAAVGMAYTLDADDMIFGSHRSHGEVLAKGYAAIKRLDGDTLYGIMKDFQDGAALSAVEKHNTTGDIKDLASDFLLYGFMAELFGRDNGFTRGLGNSMHVFFTPFGIYPNNAIVGGSAGIAAGAGLYKRVNGKPGMVVCNIGDGSLGCGPVWEAMNFAAQGQFTRLWDEEHRGGLPVLFHFLNNQYGMGGQTSGETMAFDILARAGAGISPTQLHAERVDGYNVFAVIDAFERKRKILENREGPVLLDTVTYRYAGHSATDASTYREKEEIEAWQAVDSIRAFRENLALPAECDAVEHGIRERITKIMRLAIDEAVSPRVDLFREPDGIRRYMFSNAGTSSSPSPADRADVLIPKEQNPRLQKIRVKSRSVFDKAGKPVSKLKQYNIRDALFEAILDRFYDDPSLIAFGEDNRDWGGAFGVYGGLTESIPYHRFFNTPISEGTIVAAAAGYALCGGRAIPELMYCDFLGRARVEGFNQLAQSQALSP